MIRASVQGPPLPRSGSRDDLVVRPGSAEAVEVADVVGDDVAVAVAVELVAPGRGFASF
jgi:hypothetical protein